MFKLYNGNCMRNQYIGTKLSLTSLLCLLLYPHVIRLSLELGDIHAK